MDYKWETHSIGWLKDALVYASIILFVGAVLMAIAVVPLIKVREFRGSIETYAYQAAQAATPSDFAVNLRQLNRALLDAGMDKGTTALLISGPHDDMAFKRLRLLSLAQRAEALETLPVSSIEVSTGLADLRVALSNVNLGVYDFWLWQQGGVWFQFYIPAIVFFLGVAALRVSDILPYSYKSRVKVTVSPV